jgi:hypothetical protein
MDAGIDVLAVANVLDDDETMVSLCQVRVRIDESSIFDDRTLLLLLTVLKTNDFNIGQPARGPSDTLLYLCQHSLKSGVKHSIIHKELHSIMKYTGTQSRDAGWTCA